MYLFFILFTNDTNALFCDDNCTLSVLFREAKQTDNNGPSLKVLAEGTTNQKVPAADGSEGKPQTFSQDNRPPPKHCDDSDHLGQPQLSEEPHSSIQFVDSAVKEREVESKASHQNQAKDVASLLLKVSSRAPKSNESQEVAVALNGSGPVLVANGEPSRTAESATPHMNGGDMDREKAFRLAERLFKLDGIQRVDVVKHFDKE